MQLKHTPTPWVARGSELNPKRINIVAEGQGMVPLIGIAEGNLNAEANAEFIVLACNSHSELIDICQEVLKRWTPETGRQLERLLGTHFVNRINAALKAGGAQ